MRIAIVGGGVSGLGAAWALRDCCDVTLYEKDVRPGGHANTVRVAYDDAELDVDTGFIVFNEPNYPHFTALLDHLGVASRASDMSFSVSDPFGYEWSSSGLSGLFAWKRNLTRPAFLAMLNDIVRFNACARADLKADRINGATLEEYVGGLRMSRAFLDNYLLPMGAAIWSTPERDMLAYPAASFLHFFDNHRLLHAVKTPWRTVEGGSQTYVAALMAALGPRVRIGHAALRVSRDDTGVSITSRSGGIERFDHAILACHSDQALALLADADERERTLLGAIRYAPNTAYLHRDRALMPRRPAAWASWNYLRGAGAGDGAVCVSYWMNRLQGVADERPLFVTLNPAHAPDELLTFARFDYDHPQFDTAALRAQSQVIADNGARRTWFAGAWLGHGFHEDGLASGLRVAERLGAHLPWAVPARGRAAPRRTPLIVGAPAAVAA
jgi:hypothetical protein